MWPVAQWHVLLGAAILETGHEEVHSIPGDDAHVVRLLVCILYGVIFFDPAECIPEIRGTGDGMLRGVLLTGGLLCDGGVDGGEEGVGEGGWGGEFGEDLFGVWGGDGVGVVGARVGGGGEGGGGVGGFHLGVG